MNKVERAALSSNVRKMLNDLPDPEQSNPHKWVPIHNSRDKVKEMSLEVIEALPGRILAPEAFLLSDGGVCFQWYKKDDPASRDTATIAVYKNGMIVLCTWINGKAMLNPRSSGRVKDIIKDFSKTLEPEFPNGKC